MADRPTSVPGRFSDWRLSSLLLICSTWIVLQFGGLFSPGLLDDVDSVYTEVAREMLARHDYVTPTVDGIRFFDKPPLMYWMAAASMHLFGARDWAARLPLAAGVLLLMVAVYALGIRLFRDRAPQSAPDRGGLYAALATGACLGTYLYTRFYIPDVLLALWMTLAVHLLLVALEHLDQNRSARTPSLLFAAILALNVLTKGLIGIVFPVGFVLVYLVWTRRMRDLFRLHLLESGLVFLAIAAPWHILAALRNPPIAMPAGLGLPKRAGWAWFYLYNEHVARFLGRRIPHDYGQVPIPLFWLLLFLWLFPWTAFLLPALLNAFRALRRNGRAESGMSQNQRHQREEPVRAEKALLLWAALILGFFTLSSRQEYYHLPALPALALLAGGLLALADQEREQQQRTPTVSAVAGSSSATAQALTASRWFLLPFGTILFLICAFFAVWAPTPPPGATLSSLLNQNAALYTLSLGHVFDLTGRAMGLFRGPLLLVALAMLLLGPATHILRHYGRLWAANLLLTAAAVLVLLGVHEGLVRFYPILGSKDLARSVQQLRKPDDLVAIDGELTSGSTLLFYGRPPVYLVNGRVNGPWFGSFWPDAPSIFWSDSNLEQAWAGPHRVFLLTYHPEQRTGALQGIRPVYVIASAGGKTILSNLR